MNKTERQETVESLSAMLKDSPILCGFRGLEVADRNRPVISGSDSGEVLSASSRSTTTQMTKCWLDLA